MEVITSNKGGQKLILGGFMYTKQLTQPRKIRWRCVKRTTNCKASLTTTLDSSVSAVKCRAQMKQQAKQSSEKTSQIYTQAAAEIDVDAMVQLGREESVKRTLRNQRLNLLPAVPDSLHDLVIDGIWSQTSGPHPQQFPY